MAIYRMTEAEKTKITNIAPLAEVNVLDGIIVDGDTLSITSKKSTIPVANSSTLKDGLITWEEKVLIADHETKLMAMAGAYIYRGVISQTQPTQQQLTDRINVLLSRTPTLGDVLLDSNGVEWYFDGTNWLNMGQNIIGNAGTDVYGLVKSSTDITYTNGVGVVNQSSKVKQVLTVGAKTFDGSTAVEIVTSDVGAEPARTLATLAEVREGTVTTVRGFNPQRVKQATAYSQISVTATKTLALTDAYQFLVASSASAIVLTVPPGSSVDFALNTEIIIVRYGAGTVVFAEGTGVTIYAENGKRSILTQYQTVTLKYLGLDVWLLTGALAT